MAAHPDDEVLAAGIWIHRRRSQSIHVLHITDGSPKNMVKARSLGFSTRRAYAEARRRELAAALNMAGIPPENCIRFNFSDQDVFRHLPTLVNQMEDLIGRLKPSRVLSPAYEGGHPDHDAAAFAVAAVRKRRQSFSHWEFPLYHSGPRGGLVTARFVVNGVAHSETTILLSPGERRLKSQMLAEFSTQADFLRCFKLGQERFRRALKYDFTKPPHFGPLLYERWGWGISGEEWRRRAGTAGAR